MTQDAVVTRLLPDQMAEVAVARTTACGGSCGSCESCIFQGEIKAVARNLIGARPGQRVVIASRSSSVFGAAALVYVMPIVLFLLGYALSYLAGGSEGVCVAVSFLALLLSGLILVLSQRKKKHQQAFTFDIVR